MLSSDDTKFYQGMYDDQLAIHLTSGPNGGIGLADMLVKQLDNRKPGEPQGKSIDAYSALPSLPISLLGQNEPKMSVDPINAKDTVVQAEKLNFETPKSFIDAILPHAKKAAKDLGTTPGVLVAQAALETGWGKSILPGKGESSYNLFNIKADSRWQGDRVYSKTLEYEKGVPFQENAAFRQYDSLEQSFDDYVGFIKSNPRYEQALQVSEQPNEYIQALQDAGYATDPKYAAKVQSIMARYSHETE